jgi:hypothetical protein
MAEEGTNEEQGEAEEENEASSALAGGEAVVKGMHQGS